MRAPRFGILQTDKYRGELILYRYQLGFFSGFIISVGKVAQAVNSPVAKLGLFFNAVSVGEGHSGAAHRLVGYVEEAYRIAVFPQSPELVFLADDLKEFLRFLGRYREGTEGCVIVLPALDPAACGEEPVFILFSQRESIHRIAFHAAAGGVESNDIIDRVFPAPSTAEQRGYRKNSRHYYHRPQ